MTTLLALETATNICSVAVWQDGHILVETTLTRPKSHAEQLVPMIGSALGYCGCTAQDIDGVVISRGPGSYTGLRIGASVAKGIAFAQDKPLLSVSSLEALATVALPYANPGDLILPAFNARRNEIYLGVYKALSENRLEAITEVQALQSEDIGLYIEQWPAPHRWLAGEGAPLLADMLQKKGIPQLHLLPEYLVSPTASIVAKLGVEPYLAGSFEDLAAFEPFYLKEFIPRKQAKSVFDRLPF